MTSDRIRRTTMCFAIAMVSLSARPAAAQDKPDFSGSWVLESGSPGPDAPQTLSVSQALVRANVRGEPMTPFFKDITITRSLPGGTRSETYQIGVLGGTVSGRSGGGVDRPRTHYHAAWAEQALVIESGSYTGPVRESGDWAERREVWSLDSAVRLRLAISVRRSVDSPMSVTLVYRRQ